MCSQEPHLFRHRGSLVSLNASVVSHKKLSCAYTCLMCSRVCSRVLTALMSAFICVDILIDGKRDGGNGTFMVVLVETTWKKVLSDFLQLHASNYHPLPATTIVTMFCQKTRDRTIQGKPLQNCIVFLDYRYVGHVRGPDEALRDQKLAACRRSSNPSRSSHGNDVAPKFGIP